MLAILWSIFCEAVAAVEESLFEDSIDMGSNDNEDFISFFGMDQFENNRKIIILIYWMFTTLTSVGFGDYHPRSDPERIGVILIFMFGVGTFSIILGNFS